MSPFLWLSCEELEIASPLRGSQRQGVGSLLAQQRTEGRNARVPDCSEEVVEGVQRTPNNDGVGSTIHFFGQVGSVGVDCIADLCPLPVLHS